MSNYPTVVIILFLSLQYACGQAIDGASTSSPGDQQVGGPCDGCELMYIGIPADPNQVDTSAGWETSTDRLLVVGKVLNLDGAPQSGIILYYWQTDSHGYYSAGNSEEADVTNHGHIRGWVKTNAKGEYQIFTSMPAPYPDRNSPAHIHLLVKEPGLSEYWIDEVVFDNDKLLTRRWRNDLQNRGGSGVVRLISSPNYKIAEKNIILGLNIPGHPQNVKESSHVSGLSIGEDQPSFTPFHAWGPDRGSIACPVCKYGRYHGVLYFAGDGEDRESIYAWLRFLEDESRIREKYLKAYFILGSETDYVFQQRKKQLEEIGRDLGLEKTALTFVPSFNDHKSEIHLSAINPQFDNTFIIYRHRNIVGKFKELSPDEQNFTKIREVLDETMSPYFEWDAVH